MNVTANYIEGKLEEFRIAGKKPGWLGLRPDVHEKLNEEMRALERVSHKNNNGKLIEFMSLVIIPMDQPTMPIDGVYIHDINTPYDQHPFARKNR
jgi:hypothetical protein